MYLRIHLSFVTCQLVDEPKLQYQIHIDDHHVDRQPNAVALKLRALFDGQNSDKVHIINKLQKIIMKHNYKEKPCLKNPTSISSSLSIL